MIGVFIIFLMRRVHISERRVKMPESLALSCVRLSKIGTLWCVQALAIDQAAV